MLMLFYTIARALIILFIAFILLNIAFVFGVFFFNLFYIFLHLHFLLLKVQQGFFDFEIVC